MGQVSCEKNHPTPRSMARIEALRLQIVVDSLCTRIRSKNRKRKRENAWNIERSPLLYLSLSLNALEISRKKK